MDIHEKLLNNTALMEGLAQVETTAQLAALLAEHNVELDAGTSLEQLLAQIKSEAAEELDENALDNVSGGGIGSVLVGYLLGRAYAEYRKKKGKSSGGGGKGSFGGGGGGGR